MLQETRHCILGKDPDGDPAIVFLRKRGKKSDDAVLGWFQAQKPCDFPAIGGFGLWAEAQVSSEPLSARLRACREFFAFWEAPALAVTFQLSRWI